MKFYNIRWNEKLYDNNFKWDYIFILT